MSLPALCNAPRHPLQQIRRSQGLRLMGSGYGAWERGWRHAVDPTPAQSPDFLAGTALPVPVSSSGCRVHGVDRHVQRPHSACQGPARGTRQLTQPQLEVRATGSAPSHQNSGTQAQSFLSFLIPPAQRTPQEARMGLSEGPPCVQQAWGSSSSLLASCPLRPSRTQQALSQCPRTACMAGVGRGQATGSRHPALTSGNPGKCLPQGVHSCPPQGSPGVANRNTP